MKKNILLVEPDAETADIIKKYLSSNSMKVFLAKTSQEAIDIADKNSPDLVILELAIPDQNGIAFLHEFKSYADWVKVPVIVHTHLHVSDDTTEKVWKLLGVKETLHKPSTSLKKLKSSVARVLEP